MVYVPTSDAVRQTYNVAIVCLLGGCFNKEGSVVPGAPGYFQEHWERIVYVYEGVNPRARQHFEGALLDNGFPVVDGDKVNIFSQRRVDVPYNEFWERVLTRAKNLGGQFSVFGTLESRLFTYLTRNPKVSPEVLRIVPSGWEQEEKPGFVSLLHRRMVVSFTDLLWQVCETTDKRDQAKCFRWVEYIRSHPRIIMKEGVPHIILPPDFQGWELSENGVEGQFLDRILKLGYELRAISGTVTETRQSTRSATEMTVKLR